MSTRTILGPADREAVEEQIGRLRRHLAAAGRDPGGFGIEGHATVQRGGPDEWRAQAEQWWKLGATHLSVNTMSAGLATPRPHIDAIRRFWEAVSA